MRFLPGLAICVAGGFAIPATASDVARKQAFIDANVLSIFYHELGHAVIDQMNLPIFGQEEDAADVLSVLLIDWIFEEDDAQTIAHDSAFGFLGRVDDPDEIAYWGVHGPDEQRYFNHICLFYGANPEAREDLVIDLGLPEERAASCEEEYDLAANSWGDVFDRMGAPTPDQGMIFVPGDGADAADLNALLQDEVDSMNQSFILPGQVTVTVETCDEANAFYDPETATIIFCEEFVPYLAGLYDVVSQS